MNTRLSKLNTQAYRRNRELRAWFSLSRFPAFRFCHPGSGTVRPACVPSYRSGTVRPACVPAARAFTLIELLVVIAIIAILAAMLLPALVRARIQTMEREAKVEMANLVTAINQYESTYSAFPISGDGQSDNTFGYSGNLATLPPMTSLAISNSDVMIVLTDLNTGINLNHAKNPQQQSFFAPRPVSTMDQSGLSSIDHQFRDPWGRPYIITLDMNGDHQSRDAFYAHRQVARPTGSGPTGLYGLHNSANPAGNTDEYEVAARVVVWSLGVDGQADPSKAANSPPNKDNVLSWQ